MSAITVAVHRPLRVRLFWPATALAAVAILGLSGLNLAVHNQLVDTSATLATTQADLATTQADLGNVTASRDALQGQLDALNASMAQLTAERDGLKGDLDKARANVDKLTSDLRDANNSLTTANSQRDQAERDASTIKSAGLMLLDLVTAYEEYRQVVDLQLADLLSAHNAAIRLDWVTQRYYINAYNARLPLQGQKSDAVGRAIQKMQTWVDNNKAPKAPSSNNRYL